MLLLDASVWVASGTPSSSYRAASSALILDHRVPLAALDLTFYEVANAVGVRYSQPEEAGKMTRVIKRRCGDRGLVGVDADLVDSAIDLAAEHGLTAYDAAYVAAARRDDMTLVSIDIADLVSKGLAVTPDAAVYP